ncbi:MAG: carboxypeptidase-like regulatory domain-containing protein [Pseudomonadota bacterium]
MKKSVLLVSILLLSALVPLQAFASTDVTENITQNTTWDISGSPYYVMNDIQIYENITLTIQPGVEIIYQGTSSMEIGGQLIAKGTAINPINFSSNNVWDRGQSAKIGGVSFLETAPSASYKPGDRPTFIYDYQNNQLLLEYDDTQGYDSGSIFDHCLFDNFDIAIKSSNSLPCLMNSTIRNSYYGLYVGYDPELPQYRWLFVYNNTIESCEIAIIVGQYPAGYFRRGVALISGNTIKDCGYMRITNPGGAIVGIDGDRSGIFLFNNQIINSAGLGFGNFQTVATYYDYFPTDVGIGPVVFMGHNSITHNFAGVAVNGWNALIHNYIAQNQTPDSWTDRVLGAGVLLTGPLGMVFNNSIQLNGVNGVTPQDSHGDGIALTSSENNTFYINHNNLGNSVWDMQDIYLFADGEDCASTKLMNVDAKWNSMTENPSEHIYDQNDDTCAGTVDYLPVLSSAMIPAPIDAHPSLAYPEDNAYFAGKTAIAFSWEPVAEATKYMICIFGKDTHYTFYSLNKIEIVDSTSVDIDFSSMMASDYGMKVIHWFVVAGNDNGWSLPSEVRKVTFSPDPFLVTGKVLDENEIPVAQTFLGYPPHGSDTSLYSAVFCFSDENGNYSLIPEDSNGQMSSETYLLQKRGYVTCYTFPRAQREFDIARDLTIISTAKRNAIYNAVGMTHDTKKGDVAGVVINRNDQALIGAEVFIEPPSGTIYYLDDSGNPDLSLTKTGISGKFVILNVKPGDYQLSATLDGYTFSPTISVHEDAITVDALIESSSDSDDATNSSGGGGGGGSGGGCFIATAAFGSYISPHVKILRDFRDACLLTNRAGQGFVRLYYKYSPPVADFIAKHGILKAAVRCGLYPLVGLSYVALHTTPAHQVSIVLGLVFAFSGIVMVRRRVK